MSALLLVCAALTACLAAYAVGHYASAAVFVASRAAGRVARAFTDYPDDAVAVLIPAKNEGERALRVITSLLQQDHRGPVEIYLLVKGSDDSAIPYLRAEYPHANFAQPAGAVVEMYASEGRTVAMLYAGADAKSEKVNTMTSRLRTRYLGILDCDHQAHPSWLRSSICLLQEQRARVVQGRREPISAHGFFQLWDSLHQHVGCELLNVAFTRAGLTVFFTGTTAVMETELLQTHPLGASITEDTDLAYRLFVEGERIISNPHFGSDEETSPDLYSFLARRRRWANGHTEAFLRQLPRLGAAPVRAVDRVQFFFHGSHYLVSVVVFLLHLLIGVYFVGKLSPVSAGAALASSLILAVMIARTQRTAEWSARITEAAVLFAWVFPAVVIALNLIQAALMHDLPRAVLPIPAALQVLGLFGLFAPLVLLLVGMAGFGQLGVGSFLAVVLTYPLAFYLDISGVLLGMADLVTRRARWRPVARAEPALEIAIQAPSSLLPTLGIRRSWHARPVLASLRGAFAQDLPTLNKPVPQLAVATLLALFVAGVMYTPTDTIPVADVACEVLPHDGDPWIVPADRLASYCDLAQGEVALPGHRTGAFEVVRQDDLSEIDPTYWERGDKTFFCNEAVFSPENVIPGEHGGVALQLDARPNGDRAYSSAALSTRDATFTYGRFEAVMKAPKASGIITAFFLYRFDPWQEIDAEFLGKDPTKILLNVYYNPGQPGDLYNYGFRGTPVVIDLGFDASADFHKYAIEWEEDEIRWFVDDKLIHARASGRPTPIPHLPMRVHVNTWPCCSEELAGPFDPAALPVRAEVRSVTLSTWHPPPITGLRALVGSGDWREEAAWMQP